MFCRKISGLLEVSSLAAHGNCRLEVKFELSGSLYERVKLCGIFQFRIAVEQKRGVICRCSLMVVEFLQVLDQVVNPLCIQELCRFSSLIAYTYRLDLPFG